MSITNPTPYKKSIQTYIFKHRHQRNLTDKLPRIKQMKKCRSKNEEKMSKNSVNEIQIIQNQ